MKSRVWTLGCAVLSACRDGLIYASITGHSCSQGTIEEQAYVLRRASADPVHIEHGLLEMLTRPGQTERRPICVFLSYDQDASLHLANVDQQQQRIARHENLILIANGRIKCMELRTRVRLRNVDTSSTPMRPMSSRYFRLEFERVWFEGMLQSIQGWCMQNEAPPNA